MLKSLIGLATAAALLWPGAVVAQDRLEDWTVAVVQADWRDGRGAPIEAFDNARRDLVSGFARAGFSGENILDLNLDTRRSDADTPGSIRQALTEQARAATAGCLIYFTSHGAPDGMVYGDGPRLAPDAMANLVRGACGQRPTVVVVSACFSGIFLNALQGPNRMVMTAARRDRSSFGCGANEQYPWFDGCVLESLPKAGDFLNLAALTRACVSAKEAELGASPPSEPQLFVGGEMQMLLPTLRFRRGR